MPRAQPVDQIAYRLCTRHMAARMTAIGAHHAMYLTAAVRDTMTEYDRTQWLALGQLIRLNS